MTKTKIKWRLGKLPTVEELRELVKDKIVTQEEAREILFSLDAEDEPDTRSLTSEIGFLRGLVKILSSQLNSRGAVSTVYYPTRYQAYPWISYYSTSVSGLTFKANTNGNTFALDN